jgi:mono/diheme cytochrome c family protein
LGGIEVEIFLCCPRWAIHLLFYAVNLVARHRLLIALLAVLASFAFCEGANGADETISPADREFFESKVRPVLANHCYECHGSKVQKAGLRLDSRAGVLQGGESGAAVVPGKPEEGFLVSAINYGDDYQMPPKGKLKGADIAALTEWVKRGVPWPPEDKPAEVTVKKPEFNLQERAKHWAFQPLQVVEPAAVKNAAWSRSPLDQYILAKLEAAGLAPAAPAEKHALLRRVTFDLTGLPPTPEEIATFIADSSPQAYAKVVDRLLASPHYGERWARHWLDLARYAETYGHEFDFNIPHAEQYRDYCIRAFNGDVPYNQFVIEQIAGDLLPEPRRDRASGINESLIGTSFFWFGEQSHSPVDCLQAQADRIDNQIDVFGKTFLGLTIACARCHDHKFDAIGTKDYYALYGFLKSSRYQQSCIDPADKRAVQRARLEELKEKFRQALARRWADEADDVDAYLLAAWQSLDGVKTTAEGLDTEKVQRWAKAIGDKGAAAPSHPLNPWARLRTVGRQATPTQIAGAWQQAIVEADRAATSPAASTSKETSLLDFGKPNYGGWFVQGEAFGKGPVQTGDFLLTDSPDKMIGRIFYGSCIHTGSLARRLEGTLQSPTFTIDKRFVHVHASGKDCRINVVLDGFKLIRSPIYGSVTRRLKDEKLQWHTFDLQMWRGRQAYLEFCDLSSADPADPHGGNFSEDGYVHVDQVVLSEEGAPKLPAEPGVWKLLKGAAVDSPKALASKYRETINRAIEHWEAGQLATAAEGSDQAALLDWLLQQNLLSGTPDTLELATQYRQVESRMARPELTSALADGTGENSSVFLRGNPKNQGDEVPRRFLEAFDGPASLPVGTGSGRLQLAERLVQSGNPLTPRVMVNRIWLHHFGEGLVRSPDDFGIMGQTPTHPELLDYLAAEFVKQGWSIKAMHRLMLLSATYQMSSRPEPRAQAADPMNKLWHHVPVRRMEAESIRDSMLAVSGRLDRKMFGPSVAPHLTPFMDGRGRPGTSGPLDGAGRRSIYLGVRRNFLNPMFLAFDFPLPFSTMGNRSISHVPAQALSMMNNPFVVQQAELWAKKTLQEPNLTREQRIERMYLAAFGRSPLPDELQAAAEFIVEQSKTGGEKEERAWADLAHSLLNVTEFIFVY